MARAPLDSACIDWIGWKDEAGYGLRKVKGKKRRAHRVAYAQQIGPIPEGLVLDHLCRNRACVNVTHLEPVTQAVNAARGNRDRAEDREACKQGHKWTDENTRVRSDGSRACRACSRDNSARYRLRAAA